MYSNDFWAVAERITAVLIKLLMVFSVTHNDGNHPVGASDLVK
jgi:hypothetical protein